MSEPGLSLEPDAPGAPPARRLDSWKEIAVYLSRDVTTVRRWEKREGLPVHRHLHDKLGSVYAFTTEIDAWSERRRLAQSDRVETPRVATRWYVVLTCLAGIVSMIAAAAIWVSRQQDAVARPARIAIAPPPGVTIDSLALAPDGSRIAFTGAAAGHIDRLWVQALNTLDARPLDGTEGASFPFWSPDGQAVGFFAHGKLRTIVLATRSVTTVADAPEGLGGSWSSRDLILYAPNRESGLFLVPAPGGPSVQVTVPELTLVGGHAWPEFLPDGRHFLYLNQGGREYGIYAGDLDDSRLSKHIVKVFSSASYAAGFLLYMHDDLVAQRFDLDRLETTSKEKTVAPAVFIDYNLTHKAYFSVAASGELAVRHGVEPVARLMWFDRSGGSLGPLGDPAMSYSNPTISPDGTQMVATGSALGSGPANLWLFDLVTGAKSRLTFGSAIDYAPVWAPAADRIRFASIRGGRGGLYERSMSDGSEQQLPPPAPSFLWQALEDWTATAGYLTFSAIHPKTRADVWAMPLTGNRQPIPILRERWNEGQSQISPDGGLIAYASDETGTFQVYVQTFPKPGRKWQISTDGGFDPRWRRDARELFYVAADRSLRSVDVTTGSVFRHGQPRRLFDTPLRGLWQDTRNHYDVTPDGQRFLLLVPDVDPHAAAYTLMVNWQPQAK